MNIELRTVKLKKRVVNISFQKSTKKPGYEINVSVRYLSLYQLETWSTVLSKKHST